jgi:hypothetical protein
MAASAHPDTRIFLMRIKVTVVDPSKETALAAALGCVPGQIVIDPISGVGADLLREGSLARVADVPAPDAVRPPESAAAAESTPPPSPASSKQRG